MAVFTSNPVVGIDISGFQYDIDVQALLDVGVKVFVVKLGQNSILDAKFTKHCSNIAKFVPAGAVLQCYYWDEITSNPQTQANWVSAQLKAYNYPISFVWIDAEQWWLKWSEYYAARNGTLPYSSVTRPSAAMLSSHFYQTYMALKNLLGSDKVGVYTNKSFVDEHATIPVGQAGTSMGVWMGNEKANMWIPYYGWQSQPRVSTAMSWYTWKTQWFPNYTPTIPVGTSYTQMRGHQCTGDKCKLPYIYSNILHALSAADVDVFDGTWLASLGGITPPPPPPPANRYVALYNLNIRSASNGSAPIIGLLPINTEVVVYEVNANTNYARIDATMQKWVFFPYLQKVV
jgi:hypothetical protein